MYVRPPNNATERLKVPENYRGNAFGASGEYTDMPSPIRLPRAEYDLPPGEYRDPNMLRTNEPALTNELSLSQRDNNTLITEKNSTDQPRNSERSVISHISEDPPSATATTSVISSLLHQTSGAAHFPFGHGIGTEELLILGMMLLVFTHGNESGECDNNLIMLLALLLFSG